MLYIRSFPKCAAKKRLLIKHRLKQKVLGGVFFWPFSDGKELHLLTRFFFLLQFQRCNQA